MSVHFGCGDVIKVIGLALYGPLAASTRYRLGQYVPGLAQQGINLEIHYLLGDEYLRRRFSGQRMRLACVLKPAWSRLAELRGRKRFDAAILYGELFPLMPAWLERACLACSYIYDFDDAFYLKYRRGPLCFAKPLLGGKFDAVMKGACGVTAGNKVLAEYACRNNQNTHLLPTVVDTLRYTSITRAATKVFRVGWIGSPSTAPYLVELIEPLSRLGAEGPVEFAVIGGRAPAIANVMVKEIEWSEDAEVGLINTFDVGVMPLPDDEWARGKCAFKLIQYMACAVPVVASRVGTNIDVVLPDCGVLVATAQEWLDALRFMRDGPDTRRQMGDAGRARVEQEYSLRRNLPILGEVIRGAVKGGG